MAVAMLSPTAETVDADSLTLARVAERADRYDDMAEFMQTRVETGTPLNSEERDMFSAAFKGAVSSRRTAARAAKSVEVAEREEGRPINAGIASGYLTKLEAELQAICERVLKLVHSILIPGTTEVEAKTFYLRMEADYLRYMTAFSKGDQREKFAENAELAYAAGIEEAKALHATHAVRLGLALNFSVFLYEVRGNTQAATATAKAAFQAASDSIDTATEESRSDALLTMQLIQDNLVLWEGQ
mmetsp:Transcript_44027/g.116438  ORF Transcript_44027/g.116438 Transcript_44027/m.116438 type:complete len:244 (-) Transcript_44027:246-977(-)|eukprot:CAMPEP_0194493046 /NCGR_PEP_ID=MMETSP0253-20130528/11383_1 /TAXON_ID=2966 /ORGANISM="Noctiluca scintillans" /LENGTH=243 /DNA_ID=CAMNT_0039333983 /DNA_START=48 /DNA_END=779 /DNA_ORIENTATION=-